MIVRRASEADRETLRALWEEFAAEGPPPPWVTNPREEAWVEIERALREGTAALAEVDGRAAGFAIGYFRSPRAAELADLYVRREARRRSVATALVREFVAAAKERGAAVVTVTVGVNNAPARAFYDRTGFRADSLNLFAELETLEARLARDAAGRSFGSIHVQSDDLPAVERAVRQFVPRLPGGSRGSIVAPPRNGWVAVYDDVCDRDPKMLRRLARELSDRMGAVVLALGVEEGAVVRFVLFDRGRVVDEYLSVQEYYGPLPPGDVVALAANPTVVARLTGADAARVRDAARHARSPAELPPPAELLGGLAAAIGVEGAEHGWADAPEVPGAVRVARA